MDNPPTTQRSWFCSSTGLTAFPLGQAVNPIWSSVGFMGDWLFFYYVHWQFKAGGKHAGNLEVFELDGAEHFSMAQPNSFPKPEKAGRLMETFCVGNPNKGKTVLKVMPSPYREMPPCLITHSFQK